MRNTLWVVVAVGLAGCAEPTPDAGPTLTSLACVMPEAVGDVPSDRRRDNLRTFARLYGYLKYFHPSDEAAALNWDRFAVCGVKSIIDAPTRDDLVTRLRAMVARFAPTVQIAVGALPPPHPLLTEDKLPSYLRVAWVHDGAGRDGGNHRFYSSGRVNRDSIAPGQPNPAVGETHEADLGEGIMVRIPLAVWSDSAHTLPVGELVAFVGDGDTESDDHGVAAVIIAWNVFEHFYPYFDVVNVDWAAQLDAALDRALASSSTRDVLRNLERLIAQLDDGHGAVLHRTVDTPTHSLPFRVTTIQDALVVTATADDRVRVGDVVVSIDGVDADAWVAPQLERLSGSPHWNRHRVGNALVHGPEESVALELEGVDGVRTAQIRRVQSPPPPERTGPTIEVLDDGVIYVDLDRAAWPDLQSRLSQLAAAPGVVFDMRGYPNNNHEILPHMLDTTEPPWIFEPRFVYPHRRDVVWTPARWFMRPAEPRIDGTVVFLTNARAVSYAESVMGFVHGQQLGAIVGSETAGANGDVHTFELPGDFLVAWTGMRVLRHDGEQLHGLGFPPTVRAVPTIAGMRAGRDEVLEAGLAVVRETPQNLTR